MELDFSRDVLEKLLLKHALVDKKWANILLGTFDKRLFKTPGLSVIATLSAKYYEKYGSMPSIKALAAMSKAYGEKHPNESISQADASMLLNEINTLDLQLPEDVIGRNIKEFIRRESFYNALFDNSELLGRSPDAYDKVVEKCLENFDRVQKITFNDNDLGMDYFDEDAMAKHWQYIKNPEAKISTGWTAIDTYTHGGFLKDGRSLYLVMAQAGLGKSLFLSNLAVNFLKAGLKVVVISLEMSEDVYAQRFDAHISMNDINKLGSVEQTAVAKIKDFYKAHPTASLYIKEYPPKSVTCNDIRAYLESLKTHGHSFDVLIVDYLNLVKSQAKTDNMFVDGLEVSEKLRAISYEFKVPVISAIQTNTEGMNNENVGMENISQSRGIAFTADFLMALFQTQQDRADGVIMGRILKNRLGGMVGKVLRFRLDTSSLTLTDENFGPDIPVDDIDDDEITSISKMQEDIASVETDLSAL